MTIPVDDELFDQLMTELNYKFISLMHEFLNFDFSYDEPIEVIFHED